MYKRTHYPIKTHIFLPIVTLTSFQVVMTLASIPLMDRTGRRTLHLYGLGGMFIFSIFITISFLIKASIYFYASRIVSIVFDKSNLNFTGDPIFNKDEHSNDKTSIRLVKFKSNHENAKILFYTSLY